MTDLLALADRVEAATGPDSELDAVIWASVRGFSIVERNGWVIGVSASGSEVRLGWVDPGEHQRNFTPAYHDKPSVTSSLDAAMTLVPEGYHWSFPNWGYPRKVTRFSATVHGYDREGCCVNNHHATGATPALALTAASLRARSAQEMTAHSVQGGLV